MDSKRRGLILLGTTALCAMAVAPARVGDARVPVWVNVVRGTRSTFDRAAATVEQAILGKPKPSGNVLANEPVQAGPSLDNPQAVQDGSALKQAYVVAAADERIRALGYDPAGIEDAIAAYRSENVAAGDAIAARNTDPLVRTALEWVALRDGSQRIGLQRLETFEAAHPDWPAQTWFRHQTEGRIARLTDPKAVERFFSNNAPVTSVGKYALAKALKSDGRAAEGVKIARTLFRENDLSAFTEGKVKADFGADLTKADYKYRADRLMYKEQVGPSLHYASLAGPDVVALERARAAAIAEAPADKLIAAVPEALRKDPGLILAEAQRLRRSDKLMEAATLIQSAPHDPAQLVDGDEWWTERRMLARRLLDNGNINAAYVICATHSATSTETRIDAEFHAGWIALRFMNEPTRASYHFAQAAKLAETPTSVARIAYWQGRTAEATSAPDALDRANAFYRKAAEYGSTYYGQIARQIIGSANDLVQNPEGEASGVERIEAIRVIELLYAAGDHEAAYSLAVDAANSLQDKRQIAALSTVIERLGDAHLALTIGKMIGQRGFAVDNLAFPTFGIPHYDEVQNSAAPAVVYAIARQESAFMPAVVSKAGAKGLMQMIDATARRTATKAGLPFDGNRLVTDAAFNAQLGAAHLGELLAEQGGSYILTFAAYNAGGGRVKQWIDAYGDPRNPGVDPIDWVERIPFTETRNYVQRVLANMNVYKSIFADRAKTNVAADQTDRQAKL